MPDAKIDISIGALTFHAEGEQKWVGEQLDKLFVHAETLAEVAPPDPAAGASGKEHTPMDSDPDIAKKPLATFLKEKNATAKQVQKFLATAVWLESKGSTRLSTADVAKALKDSNQSRLGNPADCLNQNVKKGFCEKDGDKFFVTTEGKGSL
jgi:hypothetical protein